MEQHMPMGPRFSMLARSFKHRLDLQLKDYGITGVQLHILALIDRMEEAGEEEINQRALENAAKVTHPTMTEIIKRLERGGFILCETNPRDRRSKTIRSTEKARLIKGEIDKADRAAFMELCRGLSPEQVESLVQITDIMLKNAFEGCKEREEMA